MTWTSADPRSYPAWCFNLHREAVAHSPNPVPCLTSRYSSEIAARATTLRQFRFLIRSNPGHDLSMTKLLETYTFRTKAHYSRTTGYYHLDLSAKPRRIDSLLSLNPDLADIR